MVCMERSGVARMLRGMKYFGGFNAMTNCKLIKDASLNLIGENPIISQQLFSEYLPTSLIRGPENCCLALT